MKKVLYIMLALVLAVSLCACTKTETQSSDTQPESSQQVETSQQVEPEVVFDQTFNATDVSETDGFFQFVVEDDAVYTFTHVGDDEIEWNVYVLNEEFTDAARYITQAYEAVLTADGELELTSGEYVYIYCSANGFTGITADENTALTVTGTR